MIHSVFLQITAYVLDDCGQGLSQVLPAPESRSAPSAGGVFVG
jgi:hypothetical protein